MSRADDAIKIKQNDEMPRTRITLADIRDVKREHILRNLLYTPQEAGEVLGKSVNTILGLVKEGKLTAADEYIKPGKNGLVGSNSLRITAESLEAYRLSIVVKPEKWAE